MTQRIYNTLPQIQQNVDVSPDWGLWGLVVPETTTNLFPNPSWENATTALTGCTFVNAVGSRITTQSSRGATAVQIAPSSAAQSYMAFAIASATLGITTNTNYTWGLDLFVPGGANMQLQVLNDATGAVAATMDFRAIGDWERKSFTFSSFATVITNYQFRVIRTAGAGLFYTDGWQLEPKAYPTTYVDGNVQDCYWTGGNDISQSVRPSNVAGGRYYNLRTDFGLIGMSGFQGAGLSNVDNVSQPYGLLGGAFYQRTTLGERVINLPLRLQSKSGIQGLLKLRKVLQAAVMPDTASQQGKALLLAFQMGDCNGPLGRMVTTPVYYNSGLEGNISNPALEDVTLQFTDFTQVGFKELFDNYPALNVPGQPGGGYVLLTRTSDGVFSAITSASQITSLHYDQARTLWYANYTIVTNGTTSQATNGAGLVILSDPNNILYVGGAFTTPQNYIMKYTPGSGWSAVGATINGVVRALAISPQSGILYAGGDFAAPASRLGAWNGAAWSAVGTGANNSVRALIAAQDRYLYIMGDFTTLNGIANNRVGRYNTSTGAYGSAMGTGISGGGGTVNCGAIGPDGRLYVGGDFTTAGGVTATNIAVWNGTSWSALGANNLTGVVKSLSFDNQGNLIIGGSNIGVTGVQTTRGGVKWNGSSYLPLDVTGADVTVEFTVLASSKTGNNTAYSVTPGAYATNYPNVISINNNSNINAYPTIVLPINSNSTTYLYGVFNYTTQKAIYFNYGYIGYETLTMFTDPKIGIKLISSFFGDVTSAILPGSDLGTFSLVPGINKIGLLNSNQQLNGFVGYKNTYASVDGVVN